jgi:RNA-directed DNA polymerase
MFHKALRYAKYTHPTKPVYWLKKKYWGQLNLERLDNWTFGDKQTGSYLLKFSWFPIERHTLVKGTASPDDPRLKDYWAKRQAAKAKDLTPSKQKLATRQHGQCPQCGESLFNDEELQLHHQQARSEGGTNSYRNLSLVHLLCHQHIHAKAQPKDGVSRCRKYNDQEHLASPERLKSKRRPKQEEEKEP